MVGIGEAYFAAFALALGFGEVTTGMLGTIPMLAGSTLQLVSPLGVRWLGSHRLWVVACATVQALSFLPLLVGALLGSLSPSTFFVLAALYWTSGQAAGPAWNTWIEALIPRRVRPAFFARRSRMAQGFVICGLLAGGLALDAGKAHGDELLTFAVLFGIAAVSRLVSAHYLAAQEAGPPCAASPASSVNLRGLWGRLWRAPDGKLVVYMLAVTVAVNVSAPFFNPFMLRELGLPYDRYMVLLIAAVVARIVALPLLGALARRKGARWLLFVGGVGIVPTAGLWVVSDAFAYLLAAQAFAGVVWAAYELATQLLILEIIRREERTLVLTWYTFAHAVAMVGGSSVGGIVLSGLGHGHAAYAAVFLLSTAARALSVLFLLRVATTPRTLVALAQRIVAVSPNVGAMVRPIVPSIADEAPKPLRQRATDVAVSEELPPR